VKSYVNGGIETDTLVASQVILLVRTRTGECGETFWEWCKWSGRQCHHCTHVGTSHP